MCRCSLNRHALSMRMPVCISPVQINVDNTCRLACEGHHVRCNVEKHKPVALHQKGYIRTCACCVHVHVQIVHAHVVRSAEAPAHTAVARQGKEQHTHGA